MNVSKLSEFWDILRLNLSTSIHSNTNKNAPKSLFLLLGAFKLLSSLKIIYLAVFGLAFCCASSTVLIGLNLTPAINLTSLAFT